MDSTVAIVTGGSRGIGAQIVRRLVNTAGHQVLLVYSANDHEARQTAERYSTDATRVVPFKCDITAPEAPEVIFDGASTLGTPLILVNNAGVTGKLSTLAEASEQDIRRTIDLNLTATILLCREAMRRWTREKAGVPRSIINISSIAARTGAADEYIWYAATKAGLNALTKGLAIEAAPHGIRVNAVSPATTDTTIHAQAGKPQRAREVGMLSPMGRAAHPDEVAAAVQWLLSADASYVNGAILDVTGGVR